MRDPAVAAAELLPEAAGADRSPSAQWGMLVYASLALLPILVLGIVLSLDSPMGWLLLIGGIPLWLAARFVFSRMRGSETATIVADERGIVRVITGSRHIERLGQLFDTGVGRHMSGTWLHATLATVVMFGGLVAACLAFDSPLPMVVFVNGMGWIVLDFLRFLITVTRATAARDKRHLDSSAMLPLVALHARHHGVEATVAGVPADELLATLRDHPEDARIAAEYGYALKRIQDAIR